MSRVPEDPSIATHPTRITGTEATSGRGAGPVVPGKPIVQQGRANCFSVNGGLSPVGLSKLVLGMLRPPPARTLMLRTPAVLTLACLTLCSPLQGDDNWPSFRGPNGDGHSSAKGLPARWSEKENIRWKTAID